ncbi:MAG: TlpA family protein disulfide reductase [Chloroflexi bacterium]|nr:MAG: TlpA family protein disulfide reductase [Chloroflexota bacterium]
MIQNKTFRIFFFSMVFFLAAAWTYASRVDPAAFTGGERPPNPRKGFSAPDFTLSTLDGSEVTLSDLRGQVVVVNFWASWCLPCRVEMPAIEQVHRAYKDLGLVILAVNMTSGDSRQDAASFVDEYGLTFSIPLDLDGLVSSKYEVRGLPTTYFIDTEGVIQEVVVGGPMSEALVQSKVEDLLRKEE